MKKSKLYGSVHITSEKKSKYVNAAAALLAMQSLQFCIAVQGNLTTSYISLENRKIELTVHFDLNQKLTIPNGYSFTWKEISSHNYWSRATNRPERIRTITYYFEF